MSRSFWSILYWIPVRRTDEMLFAEAWSQALDAGMEISHSIFVAAQANPSRRLRAALFEMTCHCRTGYSLEASLAKTRIAVGRDLLGAIRVGEEHGCLSKQLAAFGRRRHANPAECLAAAIGRPTEVSLFAAALADLLSDRKLTLWLVQDAALLAAGTGTKLARVVEEVTEQMKGGVEFSRALRAYPKMFDQFFCRLIEATAERQSLRRVLLRMSGAVGQLNEIPSP
jgi:type II secretory pathway component PulF